MARGDLRFEPPTSLVVPEIAWVLARAFGPPQSMVAVKDPVAALATARRLRLSSRVIARSGRARIASALGAATAGDFAADRAAVAARALALRHTVVEVASIAAESDIPVAFLKFAALDLAGVLAEGSRPAADVDVLAPSQQVGTLHAALRAHGYRPGGASAYEQHLPALAGPHGNVEVHRVVLGLRLGGRRRSATMEALQSAGLLSWREELPGKAATPVAAILVAHALVHGLAQHAFSPEAYPQALVVADLCDLGFGGVEGRRLVAAVSPWLRRSLPAGEIAAAQALAAGLLAGEADRLPAQARVLLDHLLAGAFDAGYADALKLTRFRYPLSDRWRSVAMVAAVGNALRAAGKERPVVAVDGEPPAAGAESRLSYLWRQARLGWLARRSRRRNRGEGT